MKNEFNEIKTEIDSIQVPVHKLDAIIKNTINENENSIIKPKRKVIRYVASAAIVAFGVLIGSAYVSPVMANVVSQIPVIGFLFGDVGDEGLEIAGQTGLYEKVNQTQKDNGITLTINEVFYDGTRLSLGYSHKSLLALGELERPTISINGKPINFSVGYSGNFVNPQHYAGVMNIDTFEELPKSFTLRVSFDSVGLVPGKWDFEFPVSQVDGIKVVKPEETKIVKGNEVTIKSLKVGPLGTNLSVDIIESSNGDQLHFNIIDENGEALTKLTGSGLGDTIEGKQHMNYQYLYSPLKEGSKEVTVIPYTIPLESETMDKKVTATLDEAKVPITLDQGEIGKVIVTDIDRKQDKTIVYFEMKSKFAFDGNFSGNRIWLEDSKGNDLTIDAKPYATRVKGNLYKQEFKVDKTEDLKIVTLKFPMPIMYEGFKVTLP